MAEVEKARVALSNKYDRKLIAASSTAEKKYVAEVEGMKKEIQEYKEKYEKECEQHLKLKEIYKKVGYNIAMLTVILPICIIYLL